MDMKKFNEEIDKFDLDNIDIADIEMTELELKRIKKNAKKKCRVSKPQKAGIAAAIAGTIIIGGTLTPVIAENVPFVRDIFYEMGLFDKEIDEYIETVGESITTEKGTTTLDNLVVTDNRVLIGMTYKSNEVIPNDFDFSRFMITMPDTEGFFGMDGEIKREKIDDYTIVITQDVKLTGGGLLKNGKMFLELELWGETPENMLPNVTYDTGEPIGLGKFEVKKELKDAIDEREVIKLDIGRGEKGNESYEDIKSLESNILGTTIYSKSEMSIHKAFEGHDEGEYGICLVVDGKKHEVTGKSASEPTGEKRQDQYEFETVKVDDIRNATVIEIIVNEEVYKIK